MLHVLKRIWDFLRRTVSTGSRRAAKKQTRKRHAKEHFGTHYYLGDLLDSLDDCFKVYPLFRKADPEGYALFRKVGAQISSSDGRLSFDRLESYLTVDEIPSFACSHYYDAKADNEYLRASFISVRKCDRPINVELSNSDVYEVTMIFTDPKTSKFHRAGNFYVSVTRDSEVRVLRYQEPVCHALGSKGKSIVRMEWHRPTWLDGLRGDDNDPATCEEKARRLFITTVNGFYFGTEGGITVRVRKGKDVAVFAIDMLRTPYFFADREKTVNENGRTKRVMHIVRTHKRSNGRYVKSHFRGLREFNWNGYHVKISLPAKHRHMLSTFGIKGRNLQDIEPGCAVMDSGQVGDYLDQKMDIAQ